MAKIAIDVALLPPEEVMDTAIEFNQKSDPKFELSKTDRRPHITLSQAVIDEADFDEVRSSLEEIASKFQPLNLEAEITNDPATFLRIALTKPLADLHQAIMKGIDKLVSYDAQAEHFLDSEVRESSLEYVRNFRTNAAFKNFDPHISIGVNEKVEEKHPLSFTVDRLTVCHLGNYNPCRKILWEAHLK